MIIQRFDFTGEVTIVIDSEETGIDGHCGVQPSPKWAIVDYWTWATVQTLVKNLPMSCPYTRLNTTINIISISVNPYTAIYICRYSIPGLKILIGQTTALQDAARSPPHLGPTCSDASDRGLYWYRHVFLFFYFYFIRQLTSASASDVCCFDSANSYYSSGLLHLSHPTIYCSTVHLVFLYSTSSLREYQSSSPPMA